MRQISIPVPVRTYKDEESLFDSSKFLISSVQKVLKQISDFNLAPVRYGQALKINGGPIDHVEIFPFEILGKKMTAANAYIKQEYSKQSDKTLDYYGKADGSGVHSSPMVARYMAISEALERWAFFDKSQSEDLDLYGFDTDPTSNGMAAYPGLLPQKVKKLAQEEAIERFTLFSWWEGRLGAKAIRSPWKDISLVEITHNYSGDRVIIAYTYQPDPGFYCYGHAASEDLSTACQKAVLELFRHRKVMQLYFERNPAPYWGYTTIRDTWEKRSIFFGLPEGHRLFKERLSKSEWAEPLKLKTIFNGPLIGPWSKYATVWRVAYEPPSQAYLKSGHDYFFW